MSILLVQRAAIYTIDPNTNLESDELIPPPGPGSSFAYDFSLSPDGKWLAYELSGQNDNVVVVEPSDNLLTKSSRGRIFWQPEKPFRLQGWLDNESVVLTIQRSPDRFVSTLIRDPFKEEEYEFFLEELPDYLDHQLGGLPGSMPIVPKIFEGVKDFARGCMRTYLILKDRLHNGTLTMRSNPL